MRNFSASLLLSLDMMGKKFSVSPVFKNCKKHELRKTVGTHLHVPKEIQSVDPFSFKTGKL